MCTIRHKALTMLILNLVRIITRGTLLTLACIPVERLAIFAVLSLDVALALTLDGVESKARVAGHPPANDITSTCVEVKNLTLGAHLKLGAFTPAGVHIQRVQLSATDSRTPIITGAVSSVGPLAAGTLQIPALAFAFFRIQLKRSSTGSITTGAPTDFLVPHQGAFTRGWRRDTVHALAFTFAGFRVVEHVLWAVM